MLQYFPFVTTVYQHIPAQQPFIARAQPQRDRQQLQAHYLVMCFRTKLYEYRRRGRHVRPPDSLIAVQDRTKMGWEAPCVNKEVHWTSCGSFPLAPLAQYNLQRFL